MKLQILQDNFSKAVGTAARFASPRAQLPVLGNILLSSKKTKVYVMSTNLEISVSIGIGAKIEEDGDVCVPAKILNDLISNLPRQTIDLVSEKEQLKVSSEAFSSVVLGMTATDFPKVPISLNKDKVITLPSKDFSEALSQVLYATSQDETRPVLTGVLIIKKGSNMSFVATDGFRLSKKTVKIKGEGDFKLILPKMILMELSRDLSESEDFLFNFDEKEKQALFGIGETVFTSRLLEGEYPDFEKIIPKKSLVKILLDKEDLLRAVKLSSIFARDEANIVKVKVLKDGVKLSAESGSSGSQEANVEAKIEKDPEFGSDFEISFNYRFLEEFLRSVKGDSVSMEFSGITTAGVFRDINDSDFLHLIMPVRVQG